VVVYFVIELRFLTFLWRRGARTAKCAKTAWAGSRWVMILTPVCVGGMARSAISLDLALSDKLACNLLV